MEYIPELIHLNPSVYVTYPFGVNWEHDYIQQGAKEIFNTYKEDIGKGTGITFVVRGTSGAMIAGGIINELNHMAPYCETSILVVRKSNEEFSSHCPSLEGIGGIGTTRLIVVDDFMVSGSTIEAIMQELDDYFKEMECPHDRYDMLYVSNIITTEKFKNKHGLLGICSRFDYVICNSE